MGLFGFLKKKGAEKPEAPANQQIQLGEDDFTEDMESAAQFFVEKYGEGNPGLDFSVSSLKIMDEVLEDASDFLEDISDEAKESLVYTGGAYIFEVARKNFGGKYFWYDPLNQPILVTGQPAFEASLLAMGKVRGRLENGKEDNIPFFFEGYANKVKTKQSGMVM